MTQAYGGIPIRNGSNIPDFIWDRPTYKMFIQNAPDEIDMKELHQLANQNWLSNTYINRRDFKAAWRITNTELEYETKHESILKKLIDKYL